MFPPSISFMTLTRYCFIETPAILQLSMSDPQIEKTSAPLCEEKCIMFFLSIATGRQHRSARLLSSEYLPSLHYFSTDAHRFFM